MANKLFGILTLFGILLAPSLSHSAGNNWPDNIYFGQIFPNGYKGALDNPDYCKTVNTKWADYRRNTCGARTPMPTRRFCFNAVRDYVRNSFGRFCPKSIEEGQKAAKADWFAQAAAKGQQSTAQVIWNDGM